MTKRSQRVGIWIIAIVMAVGSLGIYFVAVLANQNSAKEQADTQKVTTDYQNAVSDLSKQYYPVLSAYTSEVAAFDATGVSDLATTDLKVGDGATIGDSTSYDAYYIGWNPSGKIFDESISGTSLKAPLPVANNSGLITGWTKGVVGMKLGGVRELTIPADQAYGSSSPSADIPANSPLKFIVLAIPEQAAITAYNNAQATTSVQ